jgi:ESF2/ABP1 family protein
MHALPAVDPRFTLDDSFVGAGPSKSPRTSRVKEQGGDYDLDAAEVQSGGDEDDTANEEARGLAEGMDAEGFSGPSRIVKPLTPNALAAFKAAQEGAGVIYISRIPPGMRPAKVRHLMGAYGEVGRVYLQQEGVPSN